MAFEEQIILDVTVDEGEAVESLESLTKANKALREERSKLNTQSVEGKKRIAEINAELDQNNSKIKENVSALEKQKINIGNYRSALDSVHPALGKIGQGLEAGTKGFKAMTLQALAFIATPIGLVIAAIGAALYALTAYFRGSEEGQNKLNKIMAVGSAIMEQFMNVVEAVGEAIFNAISNPKQALIDFGNAVKENIVNRFFGLLELIPNLGKAIGLLFRGEFAEAGQVAFDAVTKVSLGVDNASAKIAGLVESTAALVEQGISNGEKLANLNAKIVRDERALTELRAANDLKVAKLRQEAVELEGNAKRNAIKEAIALEEELSRKEVELAQTRLALADLTIEANGDDTDALNEQATARANLFAAEKTAFDNTLKFRKELKALEKEINDLLKEQSDLNRANQRAQETQITTDDPLLNAFETQAQVRIDIEDRMQADLKARKDAAAAEDIARAKKGLEIQRTVEDQKLQAAAAVTGAIAGLLDEQGEAYKVAASAQVIISTYAAATKAYEAAFLPIPTVASPGLGVAFAAAAVLQGIANLAKINGVEFAEGGWTGPGHKMKAVGVVHANEYVTPSWLVNSKQAQPHLMALEGMRNRGEYFDGGLVTNSISQPINQQLELSNIFKNMPPIEVGVKEISKVQNRVRVKEQISKR